MNFPFPQILSSLNSPSNTELFFSLNDQNEINFDNNEKIVIMKEGNIINSNLSEEEIKNIKENNEEYINSIKLFREKFMNEYSKTLMNYE